ncbi:MAG TPA: PEGA domain-containing protein [Candidatus Limnocylindria bacterium]|nr:PEGA domain-containing protein [Candidatus Limnocylindria bacterium]
MPLWITLVLGAITLVGDYHRRNAPLTKLFVHVTVEGGEPEEGFAIELNGKQVRLDSPVPLGSASIRIVAPDAEPLTLKRFIWYGPQDLGTNDLRRGHGDLKVSVLPVPDMIELHGPHASETNSIGEYHRMPSGKYDAVFVYGDLREQASMRVPVDQVNTSAWTANIGWLELVSDPPGAEFEVISKQAAERFSGNLPHVIRRLRAGEYQVVMRRRGYELAQTTVVQPNQTNRLSLRFVYGSMEISSDPSGANVWINGTAVGATPVKLTEIIPAKYRIEMLKEGFDPQNAELTVEGDKVASTRLSLTNTVYRQSMGAARSELSQQQYTSALRSLEQALTAVPNDPSALGLLPSTKQAASKEASDGRYQKLVADARNAAANRDFDRALSLLSDAKGYRPDQSELGTLETEWAKARSDRVAQVAEQRRQQEIAKNRQRALANWRQSLADEPDAAQFPEELVRTSKSVAEVKAACDRIGAAYKDSKPSPQEPTDEQQISLRIGSLAPVLGIARYARLHAYRVSPDETEIRVKYFAYSMGLGTTEGKPQIVKDPAHYERVSAGMRKLLGNELGGDLK